jgi:hypothetical protein
MKEQSIGVNKSSLSSKAILWLVLGLYVFVACYTMFRHELWGDELHSWNLAKGSNTFWDLVQNRRYEGHPHVWYIILWLIAQFTHDPVYMQAVHLAIAISTVALILFYAPFNILIKILIPFGYYFLYEYAILSRNYAPGILSGFLICIVLTKEFKFKFLVYYALLLTMSYSHLLALLLAGSLHVYFLLSLAEEKKRHTWVIHFVFGAIIFLSAIYFIKPPGDSDLALSSWIDSWSADRLAIAVQSPLRAFVPMPAWWEYHFWNRQFLLELHSRFHILKVISPLLALGLIALGIYILKKDRKSLILFLLNIAVTFIIGNIYPLITQRYTGFIFIGFIMACWLQTSKKPFTKGKNIVLAVLLFSQMIAGIFIVSKDVMLPFSNAYRIKELIQKVPTGQKPVTDFWALIGAYAYTDKAYYCVDLEKEHTFILWGANMVSMRENPYRYYKGVHNLFQQQGLKELYLFSTSSPQVLYQIDKKLFSDYHVEVVEKMEGAIEKWSNLYLYRISEIKAFINNY